MRFRSAFSIALLVLLFAFTQSSSRAQTGAAGVLEVWLKAREAADAASGEKVTLYLKSKALVIGNDGYDGRGWPKLANGVKDAEEVAKGLAAQGFEVALKRDLKSADLDRVLKEFFIYEGADQNTRLLVWFAGHGNTIDGEGYIVPVDAPSPKADAAFREKAISLRRFGEYMREAKARHVLAIFDSCFSGSVFNVARSLPPPAITLATTQPVREFISSGEAEQEVSDDGRFRKLFLDVLAGREPQADANGDGYVTGTELGLFLHQKITNVTNNRQTPRYGKLNALGYDRGDFVFQVGKQALPTSSATGWQPFSEATQAWAVTQNTTSVAVLEEFIRQFGATAYGPMAQARLEELMKTQAVAALPTAPSPLPSAPPKPQSQPESGQAAVRQECDRYAALFDVQLTTEANKAIAVCRRALDAFPNDPKLLFQLGRAHNSAKNYAEAMRLYRQAADLGNVNATVNLGLQYTFGWGVTKDYGEAVRFFRKAADTGNSRGLSSLGLMYRNGWGVAKDPVEAVRLFRKAADLGDANATNNLGQMYQSGSGVPKDYEEAVRLYRTAIDRGNPNAMVSLGEMYAEGKGVARNYEEAERLFRKAADLGSSSAFHGLAWMYRNGFGVAKDYGEAARLYRKAVDLGNSSAMTSLGYMYEQALGVSKDLKEAVRLYRQAADLGNPNAIANLAWMYQSGLGLDKNYNEALRLNRQAADLGNARAMNNLGLMYVNGLGVQRDYGEAERLFRKASELGDEVAKKNLDSMADRNRSRRY